MELTYLDESGDDGICIGSSPLFVLAGISLQGADWRRMRAAVTELRAKWELKWGLPREVELHTRALLLGKRPYSEMGIRREATPSVLADLSDLFSCGGLQASAFICGKQSKPEGILRDTLSNLVVGNQGAYRLYLSDRGRVPAMRRIMLMDNLSDYAVETMVELDSSKSCFIQLADAVATAAHITWSGRLGLPSHSRLRPEDRAAVVALTEGPNRKCFLVRP
jgi:hypothetical protein